MGRASSRKKRDIYDDGDGGRRKGLRPGASLMSLIAIGLGSAIVWNAFHGQHQPRSMESLLAEVPDGASTSIVVPAPGKASRTITIKYDPEVEDVQRELLATGHYRGLVDGVMGNQTAVAIRLYQNDNALAPDGKLTPGLLDHIRFLRKVASAAEQSGSIAPVNAIAPLQKPAPRKTDDGRVRILDVQMRLQRLGYVTVPTDGRESAALRAAILQFELDRGLAMEGRIDAAFLSALKSAEAGQSLAAH